MAPLYKKKVVKKFDMYQECQKGRVFSLDRARLKCFQFKRVSVNLLLNELTAGFVLFAVKGLDVLVTVEERFVSCTLLVFKTYLVVTGFIYHNCSWKFFCGNIA